MVYVVGMPRDLDRPQWKGQRPWFEIWFAVVLDARRRRALWVRQTLFVPRTGDGRATTWGAWFDADAVPPTRAAKRFGSLERARLDEPASGDQPLIQIEDCWLGRTGAAGSVAGLAWDVGWTGGRPVHDEVPAWLPAPTHARRIVHDAEATGRVTLGDETCEIAGRAIALHLWGKRRLPTLQWIYAPWIGDGSLEIQAASLQDRFSLGLAMLRLDGPGGRTRAPTGPLDPRGRADPGLPRRPSSLSGRPATSAHASCLVTATVAGARRLIHARAWAEPETMVGYAYRRR